MTFAFDSIDQNVMTSSTSGKFTFQQVQRNTIKIEFYVSWKPLKNLFSWPFVAYYIYMVQWLHVKASPNLKEFFYYFRWFCYRPKVTLSLVYSPPVLYSLQGFRLVIYTFTVCVNMKWRFSFVYSFQYDKCLEACRSAAIKLFDFFRLSVERKLSKVWYVICYENFDSDFQSQKLVTICITEWFVILNYLAKFIITVTASWKSKISDILKNNCKTLPCKVTIEFS